MSDEQGKKQGADRVALDPWLTRLIGCRADVKVFLCIADGDAAPVRVGPDSSAGSLFMAEVLDPRSAAPRKPMLRVLPLQLGARIDGTVASIGRWRTEWEDQLAAPPEGPGALPFAHGVVSAADTAHVAPPVFICKEKRVLIPVVCPGCTAPVAGPSEGQTEDSCTVCGSPKTGENRPPSTSSGTRALERLWERVVRSEPHEIADDGTPESPFCLSCDRRARCFPAGGLAAASGTAVEMLVPLSARPWGGSLVEPVHLPLGAYVRLVEGRSLEQALHACAGIPTDLLRESEGRLRSDRMFLHPPGSGVAHGLESLLLRLEILRQILSVLGDLSGSRNHPHLGLDPESIWVRLPRGGNLRTTLWSVEVRLPATAPGCLEAEGTARRARYVPAPGRPAALSPPGCQQRVEWVDGTLLPAVGASRSGAANKVAVDFLPQSDFQKPPAAGEAVALALTTGSSPEEELQGLVELGFPEMCRIQLAGDGPGQILGLLQRSLGGFPVRLRPVRDHALVDDLFAAGTLWLSLLLKEAGDLGLAARLRDVVSVRLRSGLPGGFGEAAEKELLRVASSTGLLAFRAEETPVQSGGDSGAHPVEGQLLAKCIALGMRLCGAFPESYMGQNHEPVDRDQRGQVYESMLAQLAEVSRRLRDRLFRAGGGGEEILSVLGEYAKRRRQGSGGGDS